VVGLGRSDGGILRVAEFFISYIDSDYDWASRIATELTALGHETGLQKLEWWPNFQIEFHSSIRQHQDVPFYVLCVVSNRYLLKVQQFEQDLDFWRAIRERRSLVLFVVVEPCALPRLSVYIRHCVLFGMSDIDARIRFREFISDTESGVLQPSQTNTPDNRLPIGALKRRRLEGQPLINRDVEQEWELEREEYRRYAEEYRRRHGEYPIPAAGIPPKLRSSGRLLSQTMHSILRLLALGRSGDVVDASAFAPWKGCAGEEILVQIFLHTLETRRAAAVLAGESDHEGRHRGVTTLAVPVQRGQRVDITLEAAGVAVDEPAQSLIWRGEPRSCQFVLSLPAELAGRSCQIKTRMLVNSIPVGTLRFNLKVTGVVERQSNELCMVGEVAHRYREAFLSHSHEDRMKVFTFTQLLDTLGIKYFQDIASIRVMDDWERRLHEAINHCDLFLLFWTASAARSEWVERETRYALACQKASRAEEPDIMPIFLGPEAPVVPGWLKSRQFDSLIRLAMRGAQSENDPKST
jgi:hypothetical protein